MTDEPEVSFTLALRDGYAFTVDFGDAGIPPMTIDETPPLGHNEGPNPSRVLAASIAGCLGASLLFCLRKKNSAIQCVWYQKSLNPMVLHRWLRSAVAAWH